jgi:hypothetical protein
MRQYDGSRRSSRICRSDATFSGRFMVHSSGFPGMTAPLQGAPGRSQFDCRSDLNAARISETKNAGCSHAAKWPPLESLL